MPDHQTVDDPVFGRATWDAVRNHWSFKVILPSGQAVDGFVEPEDYDLALSSPVFNESRACARWVRENEAALCQYVADKMYDLMLDWHHEEWGPALSKDEFREKIALSSFWVAQEGRASLLFDDAGLFGGHRITFSVRADGTLDEEPYLWG